MQLVKRTKRISWGTFLVFLLSSLIACDKKGTSISPVVEPQEPAPVVDSNGIARFELFGNYMDRIGYFRIPALARTDKGTLIAVADGRVESNDDIPNNIDCIIRRSTDDGQTWTPVQRVVNYPRPEGATDPSILVDRVTDTVWIFFNYAKEGIGIGSSQQGYGDNTIHVMAIKSGDEGVTWSEPIDITTSVKADDWRYVISSPGHGIQLKDGTLYQPAYYGLPSSISSHPRAYGFYSTDHGRTWKRTPPVAQRMTEGMAVQLEDGRVMMNMRNSTSKRARAYSTDLSKAWSAITYDDVLIDPACQAALVKLEQGEAAGRDWLVFGNPATTKTRTNYTLRLSKDGGQTWVSSFEIWPQGAGYSDIVELANGDLGVLYEKWEGSGSKAVLEFARVPRSLLMD